MTTVASIWFSGAIAMAIGSDFYFMVIISVAFAVIVPRIPQVGKRH